MIIYGQFTQILIYNIILRYIILLNLNDIDERLI